MRVTHAYGHMHIHMHATVSKYNNTYAHNVCMFMYMAALADASVVRSVNARVKG